MTLFLVTIVLLKIPNFHTEKGGGGSYMVEHENWPIFATKFGKNCIYFGVLRKTGILSETEILYFEGRNTAKFQSYEHWYSLNSNVSLCQGVNHSAKKWGFFLDPNFCKRKSSSIFSSKKANASWFNHIFGGAILHHPRHKHFYTSKIFLESLDNLWLLRT